MTYFYIVPTSPTYQIKDSLLQSGLKDTIYGTGSEGLRPIRHTEVKDVEEVVTNKMFIPTPKASRVEGWQIVLLLITVFLVGIVKAFSNNRYRLGIKALFNYSVAQEITREEKVFFHRSNIFLTIVNLLSISLFVYELKDIISAGNESSKGFNFFLSILGFIVITYIIKYGFSKVLLFVFNDTSGASGYVFNVSLYNNLLGVLLIPTLCISYFTSLPFSQILTYIILPIVFLVLLLRLIRLFVIGRTLEVLYVYIFLYICSLEILPLVVLYRFFIHN